MQKVAVAAAAALLPAAGYARSYHNPCVQYVLRRPLPEAALARWRASVARLEAEGYRLGRLEAGDAELVDSLWCGLWGKGLLVGLRQSRLEAAAAALKLAPRRRGRPLPLGPQGPTAANGAWGTFGTPSSAVASAPAARAGRTARPRRGSLSTTTAGGQGREGGGEGGRGANERVPGRGLEGALRLTSGGDQDG
jgi:hypothetical protein